MNEHTTNITDAVTPENPETARKIRKAGTTIFIVVGALLVIDDQVRRFSRRKSVEVTVKDKPENES